MKVGRLMHHRILRHLRANVVGYVAVFLAAGGGYAIAATASKTIHGCVNNRTRVLSVQKRCHRGQSSLRWSQRGPQGPRGATGPAGPPASAAWALIGSDGGVDAGENISAQHTTTGTYAVQVTGGVCPDNQVAPVVTHVGPTATGTFPVASVSGGGNSFTVFTGTVGPGGFTAADGSFNVAVSCR